MLLKFWTSRKHWRPSGSKKPSRLVSMGKRCPSACAFTSLEIWCTQEHAGLSDGVVVLAHMDYRDPLVDKIWAAVREGMGSTKPLQILAGHSHRRGYRCGCRRLMLCNDVLNMSCRNQSLVETSSTSKQAARQVCIRHLAESYNFKRTDALRSVARLIKLLAKLQPCKTHQGLCSGETALSLGKGRKSKASCARIILAPLPCHKVYEAGCKLDTATWQSAAHSSSALHGSMRLEPGSVFKEV